VPSTKSPRSSKSKLEAKAILACIPSTVLAGIAAIRDQPATTFVEIAPPTVNLRQTGRLLGSVTGCLISIPSVDNLTTSGFEFSHPGDTGPPLRRVFVFLGLESSALRVALRATQSAQVQ
jgi:hypothetical protein